MFCMEKIIIWMKLYFAYNKITEEKIDYIREAEYIRIYIDLNRK